MIELDIILNYILDSNIFLATNNITDPFIWYFFIVLLIIGGIIIGALLLSFSTKPDDWEHKPVIDESYSGGRLNNFANSIQLTPADNNNYSPLKNHIQMLFFEKVRSVHGMTAEELIDLKTKDQKRLRNLIHDNEISDWILNAKKNKEKRYFDFLNTNKTEKKQEYLKEINTIIDKMEAWGE